MFENSPDWLSLVLAPSALAFFSSADLPTHRFHRTPHVLQQNTKPNSGSLQDDIDRLAKVLLSKTAYYTE